MKSYRETTVGVIRDVNSESKLKFFTLFTILKAYLQKSGRLISKVESF